MSGFKGVSAVLVLLCLGLFAAGCGGDDQVTQDDIDNAIQKHDEQQKLKNLQNQVEKLQRQAKNGSGGSKLNDGQNPSGGSISGLGGPVSSCADGVQVGPNTSCSFAMNVAGEKGSNPGATLISAYSPVTGKEYTMSCVAWSGGGTVCTGGNGAAVYLP